MNSEVQTATPVSQRRARTILIREYLSSDRHFYAFAAGINLLVLLIGFAPYFLHFRGEENRIIRPVMRVVDFVHGLSITAWFVLLLVQALLISTHNRRLHMRLGWMSLALIPLVTVSAVITALRSVRIMPELMRFDMPYPQFLLVMLTELAGFVLCAIAGVLLRKRTSVHRALMLTASLSLLGGSTSRIPWLDDLFGGYNQRGFFGPIFALCAVLAILSSLRMGKLDRGLATGTAFIVTTELAATLFSTTDTWEHWAAMLIR